MPVAQAPEPSSATATPIVSNPLATATPVVGNPLRKQTLLGIAPVVAPRSEPPAAASSSAPAALAAPPATPAVASSPPHADGPLRKQTLFGIAPVLPSTPATTAGSPAPAALPEVIPPARVAETEPAAPSIATAGAGAASDAPFTSSARSSAATPLPRVPERTSDAELPPLRSRRPRWVLPLAVAAVVGVGIVGLRRLDHASIPGALPAAPAAEVRKAPPLVEQTNTPVTTPAAPSSTTPANDDTDDSRPPPTTPPEPLKAPSAPLPVTSAAVVGDTPAGTLVPVRIQSDPPGARMFRKGKEVGTTPFTLEFPAGERFSYELGLPGYITRKVVIDGSKSEITIGMRPEAATAPGASSRK